MLYAVIQDLPIHVTYSYTGDFLIFMAVVIQSNKSGQVWPDIVLFAAMSHGYHNYNVLFPHCIVLFAAMTHNYNTLFPQCIVLSKPCIP